MDYGGESSPIPPSDDEGEEVEAFHRAARGEASVGGRTSEEEQFRMFQKFMEQQKKKKRRSEDSDDDHGNSGDRGSPGPPPEWDGLKVPFEDWMIKVRLWLATTKSKPRSRGPLILKALSGAPFETFKHLAKDPAWLASTSNAEELLSKMDQPEHFGEDREEHLLASLARITFHMKRKAQEPWREYFSRWDSAMRKVREHNVELPEAYIGFLLIHGLRLDDNDTKAMLNFTHGDIKPKSIKAWLRKSETKLSITQVGVDKDSKKASSSTQILLADQGDPDSADEQAQEIMSLEESLAELVGEDGMTASGEDPISEDDAAEILSMMIKKKKGFVQTLKAKKHHELSRGYGNTREASGSKEHEFKGYGRFKVSIEELKKRTKCAKCGQVGHCHKECTNKPKPKEREAHFLDKDLEIDGTSEIHFCGWLEAEETYNQTSTMSSNAVTINENGMVNPVRDSETVQPLSHLGTSSEGPVSKLGTTNVSHPELEHPGFATVSQPSRATASDFDSGASMSAAYMCPISSLFYFENLICERIQKRSCHSEVEAACATIDTGCQRLAVGFRTLQNMLPFVPEPLKIQLRSSINRFRSVHGLSTTRRIAIVPSSLGPKGSHLRPALFEDEHGSRAPFLISLPLMLHLGCTLMLDPDEGLMVHFQKTGQKVSCHLGPSGALRIPIFQFNSVMIEALQHHQDRSRTAEFEIFTTAWSPENQATHRDSCVTSETFQPVVSNGGSSQQEGSQHQSFRPDHCLDQVDQKGVACDLLSHSIAGEHDQTDRGEGDSNQHGILEQNQSPSGEHCMGATTNSNAIQPKSERDVKCDKDEHPQLGLQGTDRRSTRPGGDVGRTSAVLLPVDSQSVHGLHKGSQSREGVSSMPKGDWKTMSVLSLDGVPTNEGPIDTQHDRSRFGQDDNSRRDQENDPGCVLSASNHHQGGKQCVSGQDQLQEVRKDPGDHQENRQEDRGEETVQGMGTVPEVFAVEGGPELNGQQLNSKVLRKIRRAVKNSTEFWKEIRELFVQQEVDEETISNKIQSLNQELLADIVQHPKGTKRTKRIAEAMNLSLPNLRTLAEIYNPGCFGNHARHFGLTAGLAFDIELGTNLLEEGNRERVREYLHKVRPGLVLIAPPCHMYSQLQNLLQGLRQVDMEALKRYQQKKKQAKILLCFAVEVAKICRSIGSVFVLEHPWAASSWTHRNSPDC